MVGPGNHEVEQQPGTKELYVPYEHRYRMPWVRSTCTPGFYFEPLLHDYKEYKWYKNLTSWDDIRMVSQVKPAQFGDVLIQGLDDDGHSVDCAPVVFLSEYDYGKPPYPRRRRT
jgi:hypothetical protein